MVTDLLVGGTARSTSRAFSLGAFTNFLDLNVEDVSHGQVWRIFTHMFLHDPGNPLHIVFNMLFLWWFGTDVEDLYGSREFLTFYLIAAFVGGMAFFLVEAAGAGGRCLGASGAVTAVRLTGRSA